MKTSFVLCVTGAVSAEVGCVAISNLDFEAELSGQSGALPQTMARRWRYVLRLLPEARQAHCLDPLAAAPPHAASALVCWGVSPRISQLAGQLGLTLPSPDIVRHVNDKHFSHRLEQQLGLALPGSCLVASQPELQQAVQNCNADWVLKHPLGMSGRMRVLGKRGRLDPSALGWARRQWSGGVSLLFEPWVYERQDFSLHFHLQADRSCHYLGACQMVHDTSGVFRGNQSPGHWVPPDQALRCAREVVQQVAALGYWGPLGIDAFTGRPLVEINARYSFGRLTLALREWIPEDWWLLWWHPQRPLSADLPPLTPHPAAGLYRLPALADPHGASGTLVAVAASEPELEALQLQLRNLQG